MTKQKTSEFKIKKKVRHLFNGTFNATEMYPSPDLGLNYNPVLEVYRQLLRLLDWFVL